ncbi:MAG: hypothetical protein ACTHU0_21830 [Kofleriaceae bacterium]
MSNSALFVPNDFAALNQAARHIAQEKDHIHVFRRPKGAIHTLVEETDHDGIVRTSLGDTLVFGATLSAGVHLWVIRQMPPDTYPPFWARSGLHHKGLGPEAKGAFTPPLQINAWGKYVIDLYALPNDFGKVEPSHRVASVAIEVSSRSGVRDAVAAEGTPFSWERAHQDALENLRRLDEVILKAREWEERLAAVERPAPSPSPLPSRAEGMGLTQADEERIRAFSAAHKDRIEAWTGKPLADVSTTEIFSWAFLAGRGEQIKAALDDHGRPGEVAKASADEEQQPSNDAPLPDDADTTDETPGMRIEDLRKRIEDLRIRRLAHLVERAEHCAHWQNMTGIDECLDAALKLVNQLRYS